MRSRPPQRSRPLLNTPLPSQKGKCPCSIRPQCPSIRTVPLGTPTHPYVAAQIYTALTLRTGQCWSPTFLGHQCILHFYQLNLIHLTCLWCLAPLVTPTGRLAGRIPCVLSLLVCYVGMPDFYPLPCPHASPVTAHRFYKESITAKMERRPFSDITRSSTGYPRISTLYLFQAENCNRPPLVTRFIPLASLSHSSCLLPFAIASFHLNTLPDTLPYTPPQPPNRLQSTVGM